MGKRYDVKCDLCKKVIETTDDFVRSVQGGTCPKCRRELFDELKGRKRK